MPISPEARSLLSLILNTFLTSRAHPKTICPSEIPRSLSSSQLKELGVKEWRDLMDDVRELVWEMRERGEVEVMQKGEVLGDEVQELGDVRGPIRVRLVRDEEGD